MYSEEEYIFFALRLIKAKLLLEESYNQSMNNNKYVLNEQNQKFYDTFDTDERKDLDKLAQKIFDDVVSFFDKIKTRSNVSLSFFFGTTLKRIQKDFWYIIEA